MILSLSNLDFLLCLLFPKLSHASWSRNCYDKYKTRPKGTVCIWNLDFVKLERERSRVRVGSNWVYSLLSLFVYFSQTSQISFRTSEDSNSCIWERNVPNVDVIVTWGELQDQVDRGDQKCKLQLNQARKSRKRCNYVVSDNHAVDSQRVITLLMRWVATANGTNTLEGKGSIF